MDKLFNFINSMVKGIPPAVRNVFLVTVTLVIPPIYIFSAFVMGRLPASKDRHHTLSESPIYFYIVVGSCFLAWVIFMLIFLSYFLQKRRAANKL